MIQVWVCRACACIAIAAWTSNGTFDFERLLERGQAALSAGRLDEAQEAFSQAAKSQPKDSRAYVLMAKALIARADELPTETDEQWAEAEKLFRSSEAELRKAIDLDPSSQDAWKVLGRTLLRLGRIDESIASLYHAQSLGESGADLLVDLADAVMEARRNALETDNLAEADGRLNEAIKILEMAEEALRIHGSVLERLGGALSEKGELHRALSMYRRAITLHPQIESLHEEHLAVIARLPEEGKLAEIEHCVHFYHGLVEEPALSSWYEARSRTLMGHVVFNKVKDFQLAAEEYATAEQLMSASTKLNRSYAAAAEPWLPALRTYRGHALMEMGRLEESESAFLSALDRQPGYEPALTALSTLMDRYWEKMGGEGAKVEQFEKIRSFASRVCIVDPTNAAAWNNYGFFAREAQKYEESYQAYRRAMALAPDNPRVINDTALILIYHLQRDFDYAEQWLLQAMKLSEDALAKSEDKDENTSTYGDSLVNMIVLKNNQGDMALAAEWFRRLEKELPAREEVDFWRKRLFPDEARVLAEEAAARKAEQESAKIPDAEKQAESASPKGDAGSPDSTPSDDGDSEESSGD